MMNLKCKFNHTKKGILFAFLFVNSLNIFAQQNKTVIWVYFKDKAGVEFNPYTYFDTNTIERRNNANIPLFDSTDYDLNQNYVYQIASFGDSITIKSRWFNAVKLWGCDTKNVEKIASLKFVKSVELVNHNSTQKLLLQTANDEMEPSIIDQKLLTIQNEHLGGSYFEKNKINGKGIKVALFDAGFPSFDKNPFLKVFLAENRLYKTYNFLKKDENVFKGNSHGTMTASCIAGVSGNQKLGLATGITFLLAITEYGMREPAIEEDYWLAAAEWADKNGADIISSSLGYGNNRYTFKDMDGHTSLVSKAARMAVRKGILVVNSAGNEYTNSWKFIITPGDVDSVLTVGGIDPETGYHISYSSMGPTSNNVLKPNVCAIGHVIAAKGLGAKEVDGTSFSCPLVAGFAACVLHAYM
jgi:subtilisin family serine protease